jgi:hypothetical protein
MYQILREHRYSAPSALVEVHAFQLKNLPAHIETDEQSSLLLLRFQFAFRPVSFISFGHLVFQVLQ